MKPITSASLVLAFSLVTAGCGGGGGGDGGDGSGGEAEGAYWGETSQGQDVVGVILDNGDYWFIYSDGNNLGAVQGTGDYGDDRSFTSGNGRDFNLQYEEILDVDVDATATPGERLQGSLTYEDNSRVSFDLNYDAVYDLTPSLATLAGSYGGTSATSEGYDPASLTISASGAISGTSSSGCSFSGSATPRQSGNVYNVRITFGGGVCTSGTDTVNGIAYYDSEINQLVSAATNGDRSDGFIYVGSR